MKYAWAITKDHIENGVTEGLTGPANGELDYNAIVTHPHKQKFRMLDDDGELYYEGYLVGGDGFEPLDDFGMPGAGCTTIQYKNKNTGAWEDL